ncbi:hypothetical protein VT99_11012 [Candidatus Electrothrix marina]|uniref:Uncharacterized protein n=1 Tax=Candidatus Electrothrix marina TaxID=1859130 RepID=A0A3S3R2A4_9BACT|nr:hypothetical protein VT99_11012 [Candidatus Electrothrix marina]
MRGEGLGFLDDHDGNAVADVISELTGRTEQGVFIFTELYLAFALRAGEDVKEFFFHIFSLLRRLIGKPALC